LVAGSNPARPTSIKKDSGEILALFILCTPLKVLEQRVAKGLSSHDLAIAWIIDTLHEWMSPVNTKKRRIGFGIDDDKK